MAGWWGCARPGAGGGARTGGSRRSRPGWRPGRAGGVRNLGRVRRDRRAGPGAAGRAAPPRPGRGGPAHRAQLHGLLSGGPEPRFNATFSPVFPPPGRLAFVTQSGGLGLAALALLAGPSVGVSGFVSVGNTVDLTPNDLLLYWDEDPGTDVVLAYLESVPDPRRFARIARRISRHKPIVAVKAGRTGAGRRAAPRTPRRWRPERRRWRHCSTRPERSGPARWKRCSTSSPSCQRSRRPRDGGWRC
jgi:succinyl-CoA ligase-like protein